MRLLDLIAQSTAPSPGLPPDWRLPSPCHFAGQLRTCPLRLILADELAARTTLLAYAEGMRLGGCLDLVHAPAEQLWVEWLEAPRTEALSRIPQLAATAPATRRRRTGVLIQTDRHGRAGSLRTFWSTCDEGSYCAALIVDFDLDREIRPPLDVPAAFCGAGTGVCIPQEPAIDDLFKHASFRFDPAWAAYYRSANLTIHRQRQILHGALGNSAFDIPMLFALFLLFAARDAVSVHPAELGRLNRARRHSGKAPLLEHVDVKMSIVAPARPAEEPTAGLHCRREPRLHHVRGHIARRGDKVFWRSPHLRGNARLGVIRSRTVQLLMR